MLNLGDFELREDSKINSNNTQIISGTREIGNLKTQREYMQNLTVSLPQLDGAEAKRDLNSFNIKKRLGLRKDILKMAGSEVFNDKMREKSTERSVSGKAEMFKEFKLGGLGPILKSEEYLQAKNKRLMMNLFSSQVLSTNFKRNKMLSIKNLKLAPKIHSRNKSYVDGVKRRERMENYAATIKRPHYQNTTDFSAW